MSAFGGAGASKRLSVVRRTRIAAASSLLWAYGIANAADLMECYKEAFVYDAQLATARSALKAGREAYPQGLAGLMPTLNGQVSSQRTNQAYQQFLENADEDRYNYGTRTYSLTLTQPLFRWGAWQSYRIGELQLMQAQATFEQAHTDMMIRLAQAYFDVLYARETLFFTQAQKIATQEKMQSSKRNFEAGLATVIEFREAKAKLDVIQAAEISAVNELALKQLALTKMVGRRLDLDYLAKLRQDAPLGRPIPDNVADWIEQAKLSNFTVKANEAATRIAERNIALNQSGHLPTLDLSASLNQLQQSGSLTSQLGSQNNYSQVGITLNIPLFEGFRVVSKVRQAIAQREEAEGNLAQARNAAEQAASEAYLNHVSGVSQVKALEEAQASSVASVTASKRGYEIGLRLNFDVLDAEQQLTQVRRDLSKARFDTLIAGLKLKAAVSTLSVQDLEQLNSLLTNEVNSIKHFKGETEGDLVKPSGESPSVGAVSFFPAIDVPIFPAVKKEESLIPEVDANSPEASTPSVVLLRSTDQLDNLNRKHKLEADKGTRKKGRRQTH